MENSYTKHFAFTAQVKYLAIDISVKLHSTKKKKTCKLVCKHSVIESEEKPSYSMQGQLV